MTGSTADDRVSDEPAVPPLTSRPVDHLGQEFEEPVVQSNVEPTTNLDEDVRSGVRDGNEADADAATVAQAERGWRAGGAPITEADSPSQQVNVIATAAGLGSPPKTSP